MPCAGVCDEVFWSVFMDAKVGAPVLSKPFFLSTWMSLRERTDLS